MSYLFKDFLNIEDVGEYLNQYGYSYDPEIEEDYYRLKDTILDLYNEQKLSVVFYYDDFAAIKTLKFCKNLGVEEIKDEEFETYISGYFHVPEVSSILKHGANIAIIESSYRHYLLHDKDNLPIHDREEYKVEAGHKFTSIEFGDSSIPSIVELSDLRFPKADLDKLFNEKSSELKSVKDELADIKAENAKLIADNQENNVLSSFMMGTPAAAHGEDKTYEQLVEALAAANAEIKQHKQTINKLSDQIDKSTKDKLLPYNSQVSVAKMLYAILTEHHYDLSATKGKANSLIEKASQVHGTSVARNFIAKWIELANQAKSDSTK